MLNLFHKAQGATGTDTLKFNAAGIPMQFRGTLTHTVTNNADGSNNNVKVKTVVPVPRVVDGHHVSTDAFLVTFSFTALQSIISDELRAEAFDETIAHLTKHRADILAGVLPDLADYSA